MTAVIHLSGVTTGVSIAAGGTRYWALGNIFLTSATEAQASVLFRSGGTFSNLYAYIVSNANTGNSTAKIRKDAANGNQSITIASGVTGNVKDAVNTDTISAGSKYACQFVVSASGGALKPSTAGITLAASSNSYTRLASALGGTANSINTFYSNITGGGLGANTTEANAQFKNKSSATLQNFGLNISINTSAAFTGRIRKNGANGNQNIPVTSGTTGTLEDNVNTDSISSGDLINYSIGVTAVTALTITYMAVEYLSTASKSMMVAGISGSMNYPANQTNYCVPSGQHTASTTESDATNQAQSAFTASALETYIPANSVTATSTFRLRKNNANGNMNIPVTSGATGYKEDVTNTDSIAANDNFNYSVTTGATGTNISISNIGMMLDFSSGTTALFGRSSLDGLSISGPKQFTRLEAA